MITLCVNDKEHKRLRSTRRPTILFPGLEVGERIRIVSDSHKYLVLQVAETNGDMVTFDRLALGNRS